MAGAGLKAEIPHCTICLVVAALICHTLVLWGNISTSRAFSELGRSTEGWSDVGLDFSSALHHDIDQKLSQTRSGLTDMIGRITAVFDMVDQTLAMLGETIDDAVDDVKNATQAFASNIPGIQTPTATSLVVKQKPPPNEQDLQILVDALKNPSEEAKAKARAVLKDIAGCDPMSAPSSCKENIADALAKILDTILAPLTEAMDDLWTVTQPVLAQVGDYLVTFGDKIQRMMEDFTNTLDKVQKIFDQIMEIVSGGSGDQAQMEYDTYTLFDSDESGLLNVKDLQETAVMYGLDCLAGDKAKQLIDKYDKDDDGFVDEKEYHHLVMDDSVPDIMPVALRAFAGSLAEISGNIASAKLRDEVAIATAQYFTLISAKNHTKVEWVSQTLTNASLPKEFTADVLVELAFDVDNPNKLTTQDVGQIVVDEMVKQQHDYVVEVYSLMSTPEFWASEGFDPALQPDAVAQVGTWIENAEKKTPKPLGKIAVVSLVSKMQTDTCFSGKLHAGGDVRSLLHSAMRCRTARHQRSRRLDLAHKDAVLYASASARALRTSLLGGVSAHKLASDPAQERAANSGQPAAPETLKFARFLSNNASQTSDRFEKQCFDYTQQSSSAMETFSDTVSGMFKRIQSFLGLLESYSSPRGQQRLEHMLKDVPKQLETTVLDAVMARLDELFPSEPSLLQKSLAARKQLQEPGMPEGEDSTDSLSVVVDLLGELIKAIPTASDNLKLGRDVVSSLVAVLQKTFSVFKIKGNPIMQDFAKLYKILWIIYYVVFSFITLLMLVYGLWASGCFGKPSVAASESEYVPPAGFCDRLRACCNCCMTCCRNCHDNAISFWSFIVLLQVIVLLIFVLAVVICLLAGIQAFMAAGCAEVYMLADVKVCAGLLGVLQSFTSSFLSEHTDLHQACHDYQLLACESISSRLGTTAILTMLGSLLAAVVTFFMIIEIAIQHERARWHAIFESAYKSA